MAARKSLYLGVSVPSRQGTYQAYLWRDDGGRLNCGMWKTELDAAMARDRAVLHFGLDLPLNDARQARRFGPASPVELRRLARMQTRNRKSPYFGVSRGRYQRWDAMVCPPGSGKALQVAQFDSAEDAAVAYDRVALSVIGADAILNFPERKPKAASIEEMRAWAKALRREQRGFKGVARVGSVGEPDRFFALLPEDYERRVGSFASEEEARVARERLELAAGVAGEKVSRAARRLGPARPEDIHREVRARQKTRMSSRYEGVRRASNVEAFSWNASVTVASRFHFLGHWETERLAAIAYDRARLALETAPSKLNLPRASRALGAATPAELRAEARSLVKATKSSRYQGVHWSGDGRWIAAIYCHGKVHRLGRFEDEELAAEAYDDAAKRLGAKRARLNFP